WQPTSGTWIAVPPSNIIEHGSVPLVGCHVTRPGAPDAPLLDGEDLVDGEIVDVGTRCSARELVGGEARDHD
ncbi:MAG TPA: hypothetical protein VM869_22225, partial [Enhygromyxa sp.]|nr:hypothetical protein [Enhygromyxa sp.]